MLSGFQRRYACGVALAPVSQTPMEMVRPVDTLTCTQAGRHPFRAWALLSPAHAARNYLNAKVLHPFCCEGCADSGLDVCRLKASCHIAVQKARLSCADKVMSGPQATCRPSRGP